MSDLATHWSQGARDELESVHPNNKLNDLTAREWIAETVSVWIQKGLGKSHPDTKIEKQHPAPFSFTDVGRLIRFFTKHGEVVLDPFVGVGSTLKACALDGRRGIGIELNPDYAELARKRLDTEITSLFAPDVPQEIVVGDAVSLVRGLDEDVVDFVITSPPYWNILHKQDHKARQERISKDLDTKYSDSELDLGNIPNYGAFLGKLASVLGDCGKVLKPERYMVVIVSDFRDKSNYYMFHADLAMALEQFKLQLRGITILYQNHKRVFPYGYPYAYVPNIHHQYMMIFQNAKG